MRNQLRDYFSGRASLRHFRDRKGYQGRQTSPIVWSLALSQFPQRP
jgi:hypothetical protein